MSTSFDWSFWLPFQSLCPACCCQKDFRKTLLSLYHGCDHKTPKLLPWTTFKFFCLTFKAQHNLTPSIFHSSRNISISPVVASFPCHKWILRASYGLQGFQGGRWGVGMALLKCNWHTIKCMYLKCWIWSADLYINPWNHHGTENNKHIYYPQKFPRIPL